MLDVCGLLEGVHGSQPQSCDDCTRVPKASPAVTRRMMRSSTNPVTVCSEERVGGGGGGHTRGGGTDAATQDHICTRYAWYVGTHACIDACMRVYVYDCVCVYAYVSAIVKDVYMYRLFDCTNVLYRHICAFTHTYTQLHMLMFTVSVYYVWCMQICTYMYM